MDSANDLQDKSRSKSEYKDLDYQVKAVPHGMPWKMNFVFVFIMCTAFVALAALFGASTTVTGVLELPLVKGELYKNEHMYHNAVNHNYLCN